MPDSARSESPRPASAREEAERLVAAVIAMAASSGLGAATSASSESSGTRDAVTAGLGSLADTVLGAVSRFAGVHAPGEGSSGQSSSGQSSSEHRPGRGSSGGWSTGSAECCVCPICRAIAAVRDPSPEAAIRLAAGAGDIASGVASLMRGLSALAGDRPKPSAKPAPRPAPSPDETWSTATRAAKPSTAGSRTADPREVEAAEDDPLSPTNPTNHAEMAAAGIDPWAAASAASAATAAEERAAAQAARRQAAKKAREAAAEAARRVAEAAALADAAKADASTPTGESNPGPARTPRRFDVWAAATAEAGVADVAGATTVDHDVPGVSAAGERDGAAGDAAPEDGAV